MALQTLALRSDREAVQAVLAVTVSNINASQADTFQPPAGFGDSYILRAGVYIGGITTLNPSLLANWGPSGWLVTPGGTFVDFLFSENFVIGFGALTVSAVWEPERPALWLGSEYVQVEYPAIDTAGSPTADATYMFLVERRRNIPESSARGRVPRIRFTS